MTITKSYLRAKLQEVGFTYREAREIVTIMIDTLIQILKTTGKLDLPFGNMTLVKPEPKRQYRLNKIVKTYRKIKVHFRSKNGRDQGKVG